MPEEGPAMRASFDKLISWTGVLLAAFLLVAGGMLTYAYFYIGDEVETQLGIQGITMPEGAALQSLPPADQDALEPYAGSPMDTGPEARAYADHYILAHMNAASGGKTYEEVSSAYLAMSSEQKASPEGQKQAALRTTLFQGNTLRGLLLYGAAFATMGTIAGYAAIGAFVGAAILLVLGFLGLRHARRLERAAGGQSTVADQATAS
ncbi:MAG TPA: hypothetical protein VFV67_32115 [Actinophytocola sp.]|uniref:hypothetical protein n=1 Tax=Actinophytocola sp. TaxID=1872138 RepID=UPI002DBADFC2|nr:hypothetical protein [Actinophytocola sp.]HEU5475312.1 hypothetical protein [Actinophytocola sp.]